MTPSPTPVLARAGIDRVDQLVDALVAQDYLADEQLATTLYLSVAMRRPLLLEGEAGVGKTAVAAAIAAVLGTDVIRLQCYEGIDAAQALYEWDHARQLLHLRAVEAEHAVAGAQAAAHPALEAELYTDRFLLRRPLLQAITPRPDGAPPVLLIDEVDRADDEFEAFLLEVLSDWSITIPELGTVRASEPPIVVITSNRTRDVHDALKRRCLYHWVEHPSVERELAILRLRVPDLAGELARQVAAATGALRELGLYKPPGVAEAIDWAVALATLGCAVLDPAVIDATMGAVVKYREDQERVRDTGVDTILVAAGATP